MKSFFKALLGGLVLLVTGGILAMAGGAYWGYKKFIKPNNLKKSVIITIPRGANIGGVADSLYYEGVIDSPLIFKIAGRLTRQDNKIKAGEYEFAPHISMKEVLDKLEEGKTYSRQITIREGLTNYEILALLNASNDLKKTNIDMLGEGRYLPETYSYSLGESNADILSRMSIAMDKVLDKAWERRADNLPIKTKKEALILASIIEKETAIPSERKRVAGVFINRLRKGMLLQTDPTVIYALTKGKHENDGQGPLGRRLLKKDLEYDSPYNTYKYAGLPPTPICNPGKASIEAALNPEEHEYIYFVADGSGGHAFAKTLSEHNANVAKWRKIRSGR